MTTFLSQCCVFGLALLSASLFNLCSAQYINQGLMSGLPAYGSVPALGSVIPPVGSLPALQTYQSTIEQVRPIGMSMGGLMSPRYRRAILETGQNLIHLVSPNGMSSGVIVPIVYKMMPERIFPESNVMAPQVGGRILVIRPQSSMQSNLVAPPPVIFGNSVVPGVAMAAPPSK